MADLEYKLEYFKGALGPADDGVYIQLRNEVPAYQHVITKEVYFSPENTSHSEFVNALFGVIGVVRVSSQAWRVYVEKSPVFQWFEVIPSVLEVIRVFTGCTGFKELPGSGQVLENLEDRRSF